MQTRRTEPCSAPEPRSTSPGVGTWPLRDRMILFVLCAAQLAVGLDFSILNIALPRLGEDLHLSTANLQWGMTAFALPSGGFLLLFGRIADRVGRKRMFVTGLGLFTLASVLATTAWSSPAFLTGRVLQGLGAAAIVPSGMALLTTTFPEGPQRHRALGIMGSLMATGFTGGMVLGGVLTQFLTWRSTMGLNVLMGAVVCAMAVPLLSESRNQDRPRIDIPGALTVTGGLLSLIYALSTADQSGFGAPSTVVTLISAAVLITAFIIIESRTTQPLIQLQILRRRTVLFGNLGGLATFSMMSGLVFLGTLYLQEVNGLPPVQTGLVFGALGVTCAVTGAVVPRLVTRIGAPRVLVIGLLAQAVSTAALLSITRGDAGTWMFLILISIAGIPHMSAIVAYNVVATYGLSHDEQGQATGLVTSTQQVALTLGTPLLSALASTHTDLLSGIKLSIAASAVALALLGIAAKTGLGSVFK
ncbi:MFS transporter [Streptomyces sioyaensis]|uniref:MFS transporter n=1 Tax=Streptomyces sioyaensis TaxID=67364 RepID=UPI0037D14F55